MTIANWCIAVVSILPIAVAGSAKLASMKSKDLYDNAQPRDWANRQTGWAKRAVAAQHNGFEALPLFIAAVILAQNAHADQLRIDQLAMLFVGLRVAYSAIYVANLATLRTMVWIGGLATSIAILAMA